MAAPRRGLLRGRVLYVALTRASESLTVAFVRGRHHPLLEELDPECCTLLGSEAQAFVNVRGYSPAE